MTVFKEEIEKHLGPLGETSSSSSRAALAEKNTQDRDMNSNAVVALAHGPRDVSREPENDTESLVGELEVMMTDEFPDAFPSVPKDKEHKHDYAEAKDVPKFSPSLNPATANHSSVSVEKEHAQDVTAAHPVAKTSDMSGNAGVELSETAADGAAADPSSHDEKHERQTAATLIDDTAEDPKCDASALSQKIASPGKGKSLLGDTNIEEKSEHGTDTAMGNTVPGSPFSPERPTLELPEAFRVNEKRDRKIVTSMAESALFFEDCLSTLVSEEDELKLGRLFDALQEDSMSTAFSGVEAAASAMHWLRHSWGKVAGGDFGVQKVLHQIEWNEACCQELLPMATQNDTCLFQNIQMFFRDELQDTIEKLLKKPHLASEVLGPLLSQKRAMKREAYCLTHKRICCLKPAKRHVAGTSCKPYSRKGSGLSQMDPETIFTLAWIGLRLELQEAIVISENVKTTGGPTIASVAKGDGSQPLSVFDAGLGNLIIRFLSEHYWMEVTILDPSLLGFPFSREREFIVMRHKVKCLPQISPLSRFQRRFYRACDWSWKQIFFMHLPCMQDKGVVEKECHMDIAWARGRPTCLAGKGKTSDSDVVDDDALRNADREQEPAQPVEFELNDPQVWHDSLTVSEQKFLEVYKSAWPNTAYQLNQDPSSGHGHKAGAHAMFTLINNCGLVWSDAASPPRWMTATECLLCQGFPVVPFVHDPSHHLSVFSFKNPNRTGRHVAAQAGNSMHVAVMGLIQLHTLSEISLRPVCPLFKSIHENREQVRSAKKRRAEDDGRGVRSPGRLRVHGKQRDPGEVFAYAHGELSFI